MWWLMSTVALAESAWIMEPGARVVYGGLGVSTFATGVTGGARDRQYRARIDTYGALGLREGLQLSVDLPVVRTGVIDTEGVAPCPTDSETCDPVTTVGEVGVHLRKRMVDTGRVRVAADVGVRSDQWNAGTRGRWINAGQGASSVIGSAVGDAVLGPITLSAWWRYALVVGRPVTRDDGLVEWLPPDWTGGGLHAVLPLGLLWLTAGGSGLFRLGGVDFDGDWDQYPREDRWAALRYREIRGEAKLSLPLGEQAGLHLGVGRVLWVENGPEGMWDVGLGMHRSF